MGGNLGIMMITKSAILVFDEGDGGLSDRSAAPTARAFKVCLGVDPRGGIRLLTEHLDDLAPLASAELGAVLDHLANGADRSLLAEPAYRCGELEIDLVGRRVLRDGAEVALTAREFAILADLARNAGKIRTVAELFESVWRKPFSDQSTYLWTYIHRLRERLEPDPRHPVYVLSRGNRGYMMPRPASAAA